MKVSKEQVAENRAKILGAAAMLFRARGVDNVTVADVMKEAGLTHGAFYGYFGSKEELVAQAFAHILNTTPAAPTLARYAAGYLSPKHRDDRAGGCLFAALGTEAARAPADIRRELTQSVRRRVEEFEKTAAGKSSAAKRRAAIASWSAMVGAVILSRIVDDPALSDEILAATRSSIEAEGKQ
jgi:TetR/AcrR family transcriptional repressor of nem operon